MQTTALPLYAQVINLLAAILLLLAFAMLAQRRVVSLIDLFAAQGLALIALRPFMLTVSILREIPF